MKQIKEVHIGNLKTHFEESTNEIIKNLNILVKKGYLRIYSKQKKQHWVLR